MRRRLRGWPSSPSWAGPSPESDPALFRQRVDRFHKAGGGAAGAAGEGFGEEAGAGGGFDAEGEAEEVVAGGGVVGFEASGVGLARGRGDEGLAAGGGDSLGVGDGPGEVEGLGSRRDCRARLVSLLEPRRLAMTIRGLGAAPAVAGRWR